MKLYVMRHGPAEEKAESGIDGDRGLTMAGRERVREVGRALLDAGEEPLSIGTSPLVRAVQTAEIVALVTKLGERGGGVETRRAMSPGGDAAQLVQKLAAEGRKRVLLVGHEPDVSGLVASLLGGFRPSFDKAMVVGLHITDGGEPARFRFILDPHSLRVDTKAPA